MFYLGKLMDLTRWASQLGSPRSELPFYSLPHASQLIVNMEKMPKLNKAGKLTEFQMYSLLNW